MAKVQIGVRLQTELLQAIDKLGEEELRDRTNTVEWILTAWFRTNRPDLLTPPTKEEMTDEVRQAMGLPKKS